MHQYFVKFYQKLSAAFQSKPIRISSHSDWLLDAV